MNTTTQEIIYQMMMLVATGVITVVGAYIKKFIQTKIDITKYGFENERVERILENSIAYTEIQAKDYLKKVSKKMSSDGKLDTAKEYINKIDKSIVAKYGNELESMIKRKVVQKLGV